MSAAALPPIPEPPPPAAANGTPPKAGRRDEEDGILAAAFAMLLAPAAETPVPTVPEPMSPTPAAAPPPAAAVPAPPAEAVPAPAAAAEDPAMPAAVEESAALVPPPPPPRVHLAAPWRIHAEADPPPAAPAPPAGNPLAQRLKAVLASRGDAPLPAGESAPAKALRPLRRAETVPAPGEDAALGLWQPRPAPPPPSPVAPPASTSTPAAAAAIPELAAALQGRLPAAVDNPSFQGIRLAVRSEAFGAVDLEIRCSEGLLSVALLLQGELAPEEVEACRRGIAAACEEQGYQGVEVDVRHGSSGDGQPRRQDARAEEQEPQLAGKEFPGEAIPAVSADAGPSLPASFASGRRRTGTGLAEPTGEQNPRTFRKGARNGHR